MIFTSWYFVKESVWSPSHFPHTQNCGGSVRRTSHLCCWAAVNLSYLQSLAGASADHRCPSARTCFFLLPAREGADVQSLRDTSCSAAGSKSRGSCCRRAELRAQGFALHLAAKNRPLYFSDAQSVISDNLDTLWCQRLLVDMNHIVVRLTEAFTHREWKTQVQEQIE